MTQQKKFFHYRNAFKSDHLASADIEELQENNDGRAILTFNKIEYFENRKVAGRTVEKGLVGYFKEPNTKPMIINSKNSKILYSFIGSSNVHDWANINVKVEFYVDPNVKLKGAIVGGIRIKNKQPKEQTTKVLPKCSPAKFRAGLKQIQAGEITKEAILKQVSLTAEQQKELDAI